jgi:hypothetical protein
MCPYSLYEVSSESNAVGENLRIILDIKLFWVLFQPIHCRSGLAFRGVPSTTELQRRTCGDCSDDPIPADLEALLGQ